MKDKQISSMIGDIMRILGRIHRHKSQKIRIKVNNSVQLFATR